MNKGLWIVRKNYLCTLIKRVSDMCGGDDIEFLREHCRQTIDSHPGEMIEQAIERYLQILKELKNEMV